MADAARCVSDGMYGRLSAKPSHVTRKPALEATSPPFLTISARNRDAILAAVARSTFVPDTLMFARAVTRSGCKTHTVPPL
jgi:hypothetical protein